MEVKECLEKRRSVRQFSDKEISDELIDELLHAAMSGPSACNKQTWEFYVIQKNDVLEALRKASRFSNMKAKLAIVVCENLSRTLPLGLSSYWIQDCSVATENILLRATSLGLGSVWCGIHPQKRAEDRVKKALELTDKMIPLNIIWTGYPEGDVIGMDRYDERKENSFYKLQELSNHRLCPF